MDYLVHQLENKIRIIYKPSSSNISHACILLNAGSRDESLEMSGMAHFIEHLLFKKTSKRNTSQILNRLELVGGDLNAYTTKEYTCIHASFLNQHLERSLDLFEDLVFHSLFPTDEMQKEKEVILDEITSYQDQPEEAINDDFEDLIFSGHPLGRNILGTPETVKAFKQTDIFDFIDSNYNTDEIVIGVLGNYDFKKLIRMSEKIYGAIPYKSIKRQRAGKTNYQPQTIKLLKPINQAHCVMGNEAFSAHHESKMGLLLLNNVLGGNGMSSRLNLEIREKHGIAYTIESNYSPLSDTGIFSIYFGTDPEKTDKALKLIHKELKKLREIKLGSIQLHQAKQKFIGQIALGEENRIGLITAMAKSLLDYNRVESLEVIYAKVNAISADEILEIANTVFEPSKLSMLLFEPQES